MINNINDFRIFYEDVISTVFKSFLFYKLIAWYGPFFAVPFFFVFFAFYRRLVYKISGLIPLTPSDICLMTTNNFKRFQTVGVALLDDFDPQKFKDMLVQKVLKDLKRFRLTLVFRYFNYYWKEIPLEEASNQIEIEENLIDENDLDNYISSEFNEPINILIEPPYRIKLIKLKGVSQGAVLLKFNNIFSDGLGIISALCSLDVSFKYDDFPSVMKNHSARAKEEKLYNLLAWAICPFTGVYNIIANFFEGRRNNPFRSDKKSEGKFNFGYGKEHSLEGFNERRKKEGLSFNEAFIVRVSSAVSDIFKEKKCSEGYINCGIPCCRKGVPSEIRKVRLSNEGDMLVSRVPLREKEENEMTGRARESIRRAVSKRAILKSSLKFLFVLTNIFSYRILQVFNKLCYRRVDLIINNIQGPRKEIKYSESAIKKLYSISVPEEGVPFITVFTYNNAMRVTAAFDESISVNADDFIHLVDEKIERFIKKND